MGTLGYTLIPILVFAVSTLWVRAAWATCVLEGTAFLAAAWIATGVVRRKSPGFPGLAPCLLAAMALWGEAQLASHWTVVEAETRGAVQYWLAAACLWCLGYEACATRGRRKAFLIAALSAGSAISIVGTIQLFTSKGRVLWLFDSGYQSHVIGPFVSANNYASFVELLLPVALVLAFRERRHSMAYFLLAAALAASVIASGSRAGTLLVAAESIVVFALRPWLREGSSGIGIRKCVAFALPVAAFTLVVGYQGLWQRLSDDRDPFVFRREFLQSSIAMVRAQPFHGFGLGAWPAAYRQFAIVDPGADVNHAHNEWIQWAAEGGLPALALMAAAFLSLIPAAIRSVWGIGVIAVFLHALVDYPFVRPGLAAWIFVLMGALAAHDRERRLLEGWAPKPKRWQNRCVRLAAAASIPVLLLAVVESGKVAWADVLYRQGTWTGVAQAAKLCPSQAEYHFALAQADPEHAIAHLRLALARNPYHTDAWIALAAQLEQAGDPAGSESVLLELARRDRRYPPAWALANFYFRNNQPQPFWQWARSAAAISHGEMGSLFDLCFLSTGDARKVLASVVLPRRIVEREYLTYLMARNRISDAYPAALRIAATAGDEDREPLLNYVDRALAASQFDSALEIWNLLCNRRLLPYAASQAGALNNGDFALPVLNRGFDWLLPAPGGIVAERRESGGELMLALSGKQPESCEILTRFVRVAKAAGSVLRFQYRTTDLPASTGLYWSADATRSREIRAAAEWSDEEWHFRPAADTVRLVLGYRRSLGTTRVEGSIRLRRIRLETGVQFLAGAADKTR